MSISAVETKVPNAVGIEVSGKALRVKLTDGRTVSIPVDEYPRLAFATQKERANWSLIGGGHGIHWEDIDEDISVEGLLAGRRSGESQRSFGRWLAARSQPTFHPWKGAGYGQTNGLELPAKLLLLGESHYRDRNWDEEWDGQPTIGVVREFKQQERGGYRLFLNCMRTILGPTVPTDRSMRNQLFDCIAFYNYIQRGVERPGRRPTQEMWEEAAAPFRATLECLRPTHIVACGRSLRKNMQKNPELWTPPSGTLVDWFDPAIFPNRWPPQNILGFSRYSQGQSLVLAIQHPSWRYYQPSAWHPVVERFLQSSPG